MITTLLNADEVELAKDMEDSYKDQQLAMSHPRLHWLKHLPFWLYTIFCFYVVCRLFDHNIKMEGWANPDSGGDDWWCTRCGWSGRHIYY